MDPVTLPALELVGAVIVTGLVQAFKTAGLPDRYAPLASIVTGLAVAGIYVAASALAWPVAIVSGIVAGLTASGLYSGQKALRE